MTVGTVCWCFCVFDWCVIVLLFVVLVVCCFGVVWAVDLLGLVAIFVIWLICILVGRCGWYWLLV